TAYKRYFDTQFADGKSYVSRYIKMEIKRSFLCNVIDFYFVLRLPTIETIGDAFALWSDKFRSSEQKAIQSLVAQIVDTHAVDLSKPTDKEAALLSLAAYIKRFVGLLEQQFVDFGTDSTRCARARVPFEVNLEQPSEGLSSFLQQF